MHDVQHGPQSYKTDDTHAPWALSDHDQAALDALIESGVEPRQVEPLHQVRASHLFKLLGLLRVPDGLAKADASLIDATLARIARERQLDRAYPVAPERLSDADQEAVGQLVANGFDPGRCEPQVRDRAQHTSALLALLDSRGAAGAVGSPEPLVSRTLERIQKSIDAQEDRLTLDPAPASRRFRLGDLVSVAALIMIGGAVIGPMVANMRTYGQRVACQANMGAVASAFGLYAGDARDSLPMASASLAGLPWWNVGQPEQSNSANLFTLARTGYTGVKNLACAGNARAIACGARAKDMDWGCIDEVSYSYQNLFAAERPKWNDQGARVVVMIDRSPVVLLALRKMKIDPLSNSPNHARSGQNALFSDGSSDFLRSPVLASGDNVWMPRFLEEAIAKLSGVSREAEPLTGNESPAGRDDVFVGP